MSTATQQPTRPRREPITVLVTVEYDRALSTPWAEVWWARSDTDPNFRHKVVYEPEHGRWFCDEDTCPGFRHHRRCHHIARCKRRRAVQWYHALWLGWGPHDLRREREHYRDLEASGFPLDEDEFCALDALALLLGEDDAEAA